jgi:maltooligosyltrehalose trehalohydrolase
MHGALLGPDAFAIRFACAAGDRLLLVNLGRDLHLDVTPEPLLAPPASKRWRLLWSSEAPEYGGTGTPPIEDDAGFHLPGQSTVVLEPTEDGVS